MNYRKYIFQRDNISLIIYNIYSIIDLFNIHNIYSEWRNIQISTQIFLPTLILYIIKCEIFGNIKYDIFFQCFCQQLSVHFFFVIKRLTSKDHRELCFFFFNLEWYIENGKMFVFKQKLLKIIVKIICVQ